MNVVVIPARYGSTRFEGKALAKIFGKPLIQWVYEGVKGSKKADKIIIATDDERIARCAEGFGAEVVMTPVECPSGTDRVAQAVKALEVKAELIVNVQGDEPLIRGEHVDLVFSFLREEPECIISLKKEISTGEEYTNPNVVKVVCDKKGYALYFSRAPIPYFRTKKARAFKHIGIYGYHRNTLFRFVNLAPTQLELTEGLEQLRAMENGIKIKLIETEYEGIGVDTPEDIAKVEKLLGERR